VTARRKGDTWYIGAMTNEKGRTLEVPLSFAAQGVTYRAEIMEDGKDINHLRTRQAQVTAQGKVKLALAPSGGAVVVLAPAGGGAQAALQP
jgi:alpha-glucosidase